MLWALEVYDGPLSGIAAYGTQMVYFQAHDPGGWTPTDTHSDDDDTVYPAERIYRLYALTADEYAREQRCNARFCALVGRHHCYGAEYAPSDGNMERAHEFYATQLAQEAPPDYTARAVLATLPESAFVCRRGAEKG